MEEGLPSERVYEVVETRDGVVWANTDAGLAWFDEYRWHAMTGKGGLPETRGRCVVELPSGQIALVAQNKLYRGDRRGFREVATEADGRAFAPYCVAVLSDETVVVEADDVRIHEWRDDRFRLMLPPAVLQRQLLVGATPIPGGMLINGDRGAYHWRKRDEAVARLLLPERLKQVPHAKWMRVDGTAANRDGDGLLSISLPKEMAGVWEWNGSSGPSRVGTDSQTAPILAVSRTGEAIAIYKSGVVRFRRHGRWEVIQIQPPPLWNALSAQFRENGDLWVGTETGLFLHRRASAMWARSHHQFTNSRSSINAIAQAKNGMVWLGTGDGVIVVREDGSTAAQPMPEQGPKDVVTGLVGDDDGGMWATSGASFTGAWRWDGAGWRHFDSADGLADLHFHNVWKDGKGRVWFLSTGYPVRNTTKSHVYLYDHGKFVNWGLQNGLGGTGVYAAAESPDGSFWFATRQAISRWNSQGWRHWTRVDRKGHEPFTVAVDKKGQVWFGNRHSGAGTILPNQTVHYYTEADGLVSNEIWSILPDEAGRMWIATPAGLGLYAGGTWSKFMPLTAPLHMRELWPLARIGDELWAGSTGGGLFRLKVGETVRPAPRLEMREPIREEDRTLLQWNSFGYWGSPPASQVETRRRLDGGAWSGWDAKNEASYWSLRPGAHRFEVQAKDSFGNLSKPAALDFLIGFPVYLRPAFLGPLVVLLLAGVVLLIRGVTRRRGYIRELRASEARYRGIVEDQTELIARLSVDGVFTFVNDAFCRYFKQTKERIVGRNCFDSLSEAEANRLRIGLKTLNPDLPFREVIRKMESSTGHPRWQRWVNRAIFDEAGQAVEYQFVGQDITDMHLAQEELAQARERAESASKAKSEFLATMSHEIRTPMNGIIGMASLMSDTKLDAEQREYAETIRTSADALLVIINEILDLSRIEAGRLVIESAPFDLHRSIQEVVEILSPAAKQKGLSLTLDYPPDAPREFVGDVGRVRQVVLNFAGNSVKFTAAGYVRIAVQCREGAVGGAAEVGISVTDSGIGIPADKLGMLFEKFTQVDASSTRRYQGAGLGLAISKSLVDLMGGSVSVESRIGEGSTFTCHLPLVVHRGERQRVVPTESRSSGVVSVKRPRILVVEDNPVNRLLALRLLEKFGYEATAAGDGQEAIRLWRDGDFSAILMDCRMPEMDGYEAAKEIRSLENGARRIPIISMTANAMDGDQEKCLAAGMDDFLAKPIDVGVMRKKLEHWLAAKPQAG